MSAQARRSSHFLQLVVSLGLLVAALFVFLNRQYLLDQYSVWSFTPSPAIASIANRAELTDTGEFLFYASQPELLERDSFNGACRSAATEQTAILGCYTNNRIYLFNINNERLDGVKEVTAAHEMLHAAYQRLPQKEKARVDALLEKQLLGESEERITQLMAEYEKTEPGQRLNELHSILGSELAILDPELEQYYRQYFEDRPALVALSSKYQTVFNELSARQDGLVSELNGLADEIDRDSSVYKRNLQVLSNDIQAFNQEAGSGQMSRSEYEAQRSALEARQARLRNDYAFIQTRIDEYEQKRAELAAINSESNALSRSLNSAVKPVPDDIDG